MKTFKTLILAFAMLASYTLTAQVAVSTDGSSADGSAMFEVKSTEKGFLPPRMTQAQIEAITTPANGLTVFNTTNNKLYIFVETDNVWKEVSYGAGTITPPIVFVDERDGQSYVAVQIGDQHWMAENLNFDQSSYGNDWCYDDNSANCGTYGRLYSWAAVMQGAASSSNNPSGVQGVCPEGWHVPSDAEWTQLTNYLGGLSVAGGKMKETGTIEAGTGLWSTPNTGATNETGFTALPGGTFRNDGTFYGVGSYGSWWSATENGADYAMGLSVGYDFSSIDTGLFYKEIRFSVRCVMD